MTLSDEDVASVVRKAIQSWCDEYGCSQQQDVVLAVGVPPEATIQAQAGIKLGTVDDFIGLAVPADEPPEQSAAKVEGDDAK